MSETHHHDHDHAHAHDARGADGNCQEAIAELYTFLDGHLTEEKRFTIQRHLDDCSPCLEAFEFETELRFVVAHRCREEVPETLRRKVADLLDSAPAGDPNGVEP